MIAFDTETHLIAPGAMAPPLVCTSVYEWTRGKNKLYDKRDSFKIFVDILREDKIVGHNTAFDMAVIMANFPSLSEDVWLAYEEKRVYDTMIHEMLIAIALDRFEYDPDLRKKPFFSLGELAQKYLDKKLDKGADSWRLRYGELDGVPISEYPEEAAKYALDDSKVTWQIHEIQNERYGEPKDLHLQVRASLALELAADWGMEVDHKQVAKVKKRLTKIVKKDEKKLIKAGVLGEKLNAKGQHPKKMKPIRDRIFAKLGDNSPMTEPSKTFPDGQIQTSEDAMRLSGDSKLEKLADTLTARTELSGYIGKLETVTSNHPWFNILVRSGRPSCKDGEFGVRTQNMPRRPGIRECFVSRSGYKFVVSDYEGAELCTLAEFCQVTFGFSALGDVLRAGQDPHLVMAADILGIDYDECLARFLTGEQLIKDMRQLSKAANFGFPGGLGPKTFIGYARSTWGVTITEDEARRLKQLWLQRYPEMKLFFRYVGDKGSNHTATQLYSERLRGGLNFCNGCNTYFQGLAADGCKDAMWEISKMCYAHEDVEIQVESPRSTYTNHWNPLSGSRIVNMVYDEIMMEVPEHKVALVEEPFTRIMVVAMERWVKTVPVKVDFKVMDRWHK